MSARTATWMPLYVRDYLADTGRLTTEQHGAYLLIIMDYWVNGPPRDDDAELCQIARCSIGRWRALRPSLERFFHVEDGVWRHGRIEAEIANAIAISDGRSKAGARGAAKRWQQQSLAIAEPLANASQNDAPSPSPSPSSSLRSEEKSIAQIEFPTWYATYPRHVGRGAAVKAFVAARKLASLQELIDGAKRYAASVTDPKFIAHPATWLNQQRWLDEPAANGHGVSEPRRPRSPPPRYADSEVEH